MSKICSCLLGVKVEHFTNEFTLSGSVVKDSIHLSTRNREAPEVKFFATVKVKGVNVIFQFFIFNKFG